MIGYIYIFGVLAFFVWSFWVTEKQNEELRSRIQENQLKDIKPMPAFNIFILSFILTLQFGLFWPVSWYFVYRGIKKEEFDRRRKWASQDEKWY